MCDKNQKTFGDVVTPHALQIVPEVYALKFPMGFVIGFAPLPNTLTQTLRKA